MALYSKQEQISVLQGVSSPFVPAALNRVLLRVELPPGSEGSLTISLLPTATAGQGLVLYPFGQGSFPLSSLALTRSDHGDLVTRAWSAIASYNETVTVFSVFEQ